MMKFVVNQLPYYGELCPLWTMCSKNAKEHVQGHELDTAHMAKELGDVAWYLAVSANAIGYDLETIMQMNVDKLKARYPDGFDAEHSLHRNQDDI